MKLALEAPLLDATSPTSMASLSEYESLEPGDIIMTGSPEGVNAVVAGDAMRGEVQGPGTIEMRVTD